MLSFQGDAPIFNFQASGGAGSFTPGYQAVINYARAHGIPRPSINVQFQQNALYTNLQTLGLFPNCDVFYNMFSTADQREFSKINWANPGVYNLSEVGTVSFGAKLGFSGDGVSSYLKTGFVPSVNGVNFKAADGMVYAFTESVVSSNKCSIGCKDSGGAGTFLYTNPLKTNCNTSGGISFSGTFGHLSCWRPNTTQRFAKYNFGAATGGVAAAPALTAFEVYLCAINAAGVAADFSANAVSFAFLSNNQSLQINNIAIAISQYRTNFHS